MSDITEGLGTAVDGGLLANAVEPKDGEAADGDTGKTCLNCGTVLVGTHCHACGQRGDVHRSLSAIGHEIMHGVLHLDGKIWRTLPLLLFKPGKLTRRYINGERAKFVSPMAMFLFSVFLMFALFQAIGLTTPSTLDMDDPTEFFMEQGEKEATQLRERIDALPADAVERADRQRELAALETLLNSAEEGTLTSK